MDFESMQGETIKKVVEDEYICFHFKSGKFAVVDITSFCGDLEMEFYKESELNLAELLCLGVVDKKEYEKRLESMTREQKERNKAREIQEKEERKEKYIQLKKEFG